jgi:hypothetical protein
VICIRRLNVLGTTKEGMIADPAHTKFIADVLSDFASNGKYPKNKAYQVLRSLSPEELFELYDIACRKGNEEFRKAFGPVYHGARGDNDGDLFRDVPMEVER